jgi:hypothetical protein
MMTLIYPSSGMIYLIVNILILIGAVLLFTIYTNSASY